MTMLARTLMIFFVLFSFLSGCGESPVKEEVARGDIQKLSDPTDAAQRLEMLGEYQKAAQEYLTIAAQTSPPTQQGHQLSAIKAFLKGGMLKEAKAELAKLDAGQSYGLEIPLQLVQARIDLAEQRVGPAEKQLKGIEPSTLPTPLQIEYRQLQAATQLAKGEVVEAINEWMAIDKLASTDSALLKENHLELWRNLTSINPSDLTKVSQPGDSSSGWIALALLAKTSTQKHLSPSLKNWQLRFPNHPATQHIVPTLEPNQIASPPKQVALFLPPINHKFGKAAEAIKNGFFAAYASREENRPKIAIHYVDEENLLTVYQRVVDAGTDFIVGPLLKDTLAVLVDNYVQLPIPTLGLNHLDQPVNTGNLYQFGLSPEDEAKEIAKRAWADGYKSALALVPAGSKGWGEKILAAFETEWEKLGGQVVIKNTYHIHNLTSTIPRVLKNVTEADMAFMVALSRHAREIRPMFHSTLGENFPIYSISRVYSGTPDPSQDQKLDGVTFVDMPWVLAPNEEGAEMQASLQQSWPDEIGKYKRLYALGIDAYGLVSQLQQLSQLQWQGQSGRLFVDKTGVIHRDQLPFARFVNGNPQ